MPKSTRSPRKWQVFQTFLEKEIQHYENFEPQNPQLDRARSDLNKRDLLLRLGRSVRVRAITQEMDRLHSALSDFDVRWAIPDGQSSFILSELIAYRIGNGGSNGLINPDAEVWMPISPKIALVLVRDPKKMIPLRTVCSTKQVREVNEYGATNGNRVASHSERLLLSLTR